MNLNAFLCRFPTVFGKYIRILDQVSKIRRFHSIPFEFQGFENRPQSCFLPFRILYCNPILRALILWFAVYRMYNETVTRSKQPIFSEVFDGFRCSNDKHISSGPLCDVISSGCFFFQTSYKCQPYTGHSKTAIKR